MDKKIVIIVFLLTALTLGACGFNLNVDVERGSGSVIRQEREVSGFDRVVLSGIGDVILEQGDAERLEIEAEDNLIDEITTEVRDGTLYIGFKRRSILPTKTVKFYLTMQDIRGLETRGVSNIQAEKLETDNLEVGISGTGNIDIEDLSADSMDVYISGAGNFDVKGRVTEQVVNLSGAGNFNGADLETQQSEVTITGLGKVTVWAVETLDVRISGAGSVDYYGSPQINRSITGLGNLNHQGDK